MKLIRSFRGIRPLAQLAAKVASHPYDVLNREEAYELAKDNAYSFLHINKPEVDMPAEVDVYDTSVYAKGRDNLDRFMREGTLKQDDKSTLYVYKQVMGDHQQIGLVAVASVDAYDHDLIKKHEFTRPVKEDDRVNHMDALDAQVGPVFLTYKAQAAIDSLIEQVIKDEPEYDFEADDATRHVFWVIRDEDLVSAIEDEVNALECLYVADGHHRSAAASRVKKMRQETNSNHTGEEPYNYFLTVLFPHNQMQILDYNRLVANLNGHSVNEFLGALAENFDIELVEGQARPSKAREIGFYAGQQWYLLTANSNLLKKIDDNDPVASLDVSILQDFVFAPLLNIVDQRTDKNVDFVGGIRGLAELERRTADDEWQAAFALYPTSIESLMDIADAGEVMPPKSTWFEPKLKSGLVVHSLK
ncbi:MAG: DUF1015 family protein [Proteobacteria bacterium]|nr:DUF1015 family protein [Pseudomonadota bacterium]MDA1243707.1 DUF1015 family protein [Pseudomonadota bacterium]